MIRLIIVMFVAVCFLVPSFSAEASEFLLSNGGRVRGKLLNASQRPRTTYVIETASGGRLTLDRSQVKQVVEKTPAEQEYERIRPSASDTFEDQWKLAEWCRENRLSKHRETHLRRIVELDPENAKVWALLGYRRHDGQWKTQREIMEGRGMIYSQGRWRSAQEIELRDKNRRQDDRQREWFRNLKRWRQDLDGRRRDEARANLLSIEDPAAVRAIGKYLEKEKVYEVRLLYLEVLSDVAGAAALKILMEQSIEAIDRDERLTAMEYVVQRKNPEVTDYYVQRLKSKLNKEVNRAAIVLGQLKDPASIEPLIDKLITKHRYMIGRGNPNQTTSTFGTGPNSGGHSFGGSGPKMVSLRQQNRQVLYALSALTGENFSYDIVLWKNWLKNQRRNDRLNGRRD